MKKRIKQPEKNSLGKLLGFISEAGMLKRLQRSGWSVIGVKNAESVAEHSFRCAVIGYLLASLEQASIYRVLLMTLFGDIQEARIADLHKMAQRYLNSQAAEERSFAEQVSFLPKAIRRELTEIYQEYREQKSKESIIARDADILECLIQAKEYQEQGFPQAAKFMLKAPHYLWTKSAQALWRLAQNTQLSDWWLKLSEFKR